MLLISWTMLYWGLSNVFALEFKIICFPFGWYFRVCMCGLHTTKT